MGRLKLKILVTGLCLSRNLGGPAMGLTLVKQLVGKYGNDIEVKFAVTPVSFEEERSWADRYKVDIVRRDTAFHYWLTASVTGRLLRYVRRMLLGIRRNLSGAGNTQKREFFDAHQVHSEFMDAYAWADLVVDMSGISYVGDGVRGFLEGILSYSSFYYAKRHRKPFIRFIQSFGPFDDWRVRYFAKREFKALPFIAARGPQSAEYCRSIVSDPSKVYDFPDSAILLPPDYDWASAFIKVNGLRARHYVIISPSSVIHRTLSRSASGSVGERHIDSLVLVCEELSKRGEKIVFLPHMYSKNPSECDREVCRLISARLDKSDVLIVDDDIDPMMAKGLIANSKFSIVSRYHALVAALSTGVDVIAIGWNVKYADIMEYYGKSTYALDIRAYDPRSLAERVFKISLEFSCKSNGFSIPDSFEQMHRRAEDRVLTGFEMLFDWIDSVSRLK